jgi:hypothetical protein
MPESGPFRARNRSWSLPIFCLLAALVATNCNGSRSMPNKATPVLLPGLAGDWMLAEGAPQNSCALLQYFGFGCPVAIEVENAPGAVLVKLPAKSLVATVDGNILTVTDVVRSTSGTCTVVFLKEWTGVYDGANTVNGEWALTITPSDSCDPGLACETKGTFTWQRCPDSGCIPVLCPF